jgi:hypothetical protein
MALINCLGAQHGEGYTAVHGDCCDVVRQLPSESVGFSLFSPPFGNLFVYSDSAADMGNNATDGEFFQHYRWLVAELLRVLKPGRLVAVHCFDLPTRKWKDGFIGMKDFSGDLIRAHTEAGFILHSKVTIWKDPVVEMQRTKALGLLHKTIKKDSSMSRMGMPDYLLVFRKPGENPEPIEHRNNDIPVDVWQRWASPVWMDIRQTNTLNVRQAKDNADEKHICPLQLDLIERALIMWSNPSDVVLSPFMGIGSEGFVALKQRRKFLGVELKDSYFKIAARNLESAEANARSIFDGGLFEAAA